MLCESSTYLSLGPLSRPTAALVGGPVGASNTGSAQGVLNLAFTSGRDSPFLTLGLLACLIPLYLKAYRIHLDPDPTYAISNRGDRTILEGVKNGEDEILAM